MSNRPKDWWGNSKNAKSWIEQNEKRENTGDEKTNTTLQSQDIVIKEISKRKKDFKKVLEVGAGDGRLIGGIYNKLKCKCYSVDINKSLSKHVKKKYPKVITKVGDIIKLPFKDNSFDLVYTYQVLQHVAPEDIEQAIKELVRVSKNEVWMWEGIGRVDYEHGAQTSKCHNGSFVWFIDQFINCYSVEIPKNKNIELNRQRLYRFKK